MARSAAGAAWTDGERAALLARHQPYLLYDALEVYFADAAEEWTLNAANVLYRTHGDPVRVPALSLDFLGPTYTDGVVADPKDFIECTDRHYDRQYAALRSANQQLRNVLYGRSIVRDGVLWLQYWFWYFLNDYQLAFGIDVHEGDWEMIQLRIPAGASAPADSVYAQHT